MSTNITNPSCPTNAVPEPVNLGIDSKSVFAVVPRGNYTADIPDDWMISCCEPSVVQLASDGSTGTCWQWCDLPPQYTNWTSDSSQRMNQFLDCITFTARATNSSFPPSAVLVSAAARDGVLRDGVFGIIAVFVLAVSLLSR